MKEGLIICQATRKRRFSTQNAAKASISAGVRIRTLARGQQLRPYECPACGDWHLTKWSAARFADPFAAAFVAELVAAGYTLDNANAPVYAVRSPEGLKVGGFTVDHDGQVVEVGANLQRAFEFVRNWKWTA